MLSDVVQLQLDMVVSIAFSVRLFLQDISIASHHQPPLPLVHTAHTLLAHLPLHNTLLACRCRTRCARLWAWLWYLLHCCLLHVCC